MNFSVVIISIMLLTTSCLKEEYDQTSFKERLIVEGAIYNGRSAEVMLSINMDYTKEFTEDEMINKVVRYAVVTVSDEAQTETLTCYRDNQYPTKLVYKGVYIKGEVGKSYKLNIKYSGREWDAVTTIPEPEELYDIQTEWVRDTLYRISATIKPKDKQRHYMIRCATSRDNDQRPSYLYPTLFGVIDKGTDEHQITINRPLDYAHILNYTTLFHSQERVYISFSAIPQEAYDYWSIWENCSVNSLNPVFPVDENPPTNISNGAQGIWCGYGSTYYIVAP